LPTSTGGDEEIVSLNREIGDYNSGTKALSRKLKPQIHPKLSLLINNKA
jgi:hypothetical protein